MASEVPQLVGRCDLGFRRSERQATAGGKQRLQIYFEIVQRFNEGYDVLQLRRREFPSRGQGR